MNLEKLVLGVIKRHQKEVVTAIDSPLKVIIPHEQLSLLSPEVVPRTKGDREKLGARRAGFTGELFERLSIFFYGGCLVEAPFFISNGITGTRHIDESSLVKHEVEEPDKGIYGKPDIIDVEEKRIWESKACVVGKKVNLTDLQIGVYRELQLMHRRENEYWKISFVFHRHGVEGVRANYRRSIEELLKEFSEKMVYSLVLPLSLVMELHSPSIAEQAYNKEFIANTQDHKLLELYKNRRGLVSRYKNPLSQRSRHLPNTYTALKTGAMDRLLKEPEKLIEELGLPLTRYRIERLLSPNMFFINNNLLRQYPIVVISDRNHKRWVDKIHYHDVPF